MGRLYGFRPLMQANAPWTAGSDNWYILTSLTETLYLERFTERWLILPPEAVALAV